MKYLFLPMLVGEVTAAEQAPVEVEAGDAEEAVRKLEKKGYGSGRLFEEVTWVTTTIPRGLNAK